MKSVGKQLQDARLARNWTPELAARETKIKVDRLRDLEADDYTHFSSPTYARGFVRTYARALGLDEYKILRQLDTKLPEDETSSFGADTGIPYVPEPSKAAHAGGGNNAGLYVVLSLGMGVALVISFILFEAYRAGVLPAYFAENSSTEQTTSNDVTVTAGNEPARAKPVDPNAAMPPITADAGNTSETNSAPKALPVDPNALAAMSDTNTPPSAPRALPVDPSVLASAGTTTDTNTPTSAPRALPVDPSQLTTAAAPPLTPPADGTTNAPIPPRALPVDPSLLASVNNAAAPTTNAAPNDPAAQAPLVPSPSARQSNAGPVHMPPTPAPATPATTSSNDPSQATAVTATSNDPATGTTVADNSAEKKLVLTASRDSFVRVTTEDGSDTEKVLYASVLHTGQSVGFDGHKFSINVGVPAAVDITLDGVNYGPHSDQEAPETFTVESHLP